MNNAMLVIEDDAVHRMVIARSGSKADMLVEMAQTVEEAVSCLAGLAYKCITLDLNLGEEQGITLLHEISSRASGATVLLISGADAPLRRMAIEAAREFGLNVIDVPKPIDLRRLRLSLEQVSGLTARDAAAAAVA